MNDPYRLSDEPHPRGRDRLTVLLWVALAVCAGLNAMFSVASPDNLLPSVAFGVGALVCIGLLVARRLGRSQP